MTSPEAQNHGVGLKRPCRVKAFGCMLEAMARIAPARPATRPATTFILVDFPDQAQLFQRGGLHKSSQVKLILSPKQRENPAASRTRTCTNATRVLPSLCDVTQTSDPANPPPCACRTRLKDVLHDHHKTRSTIFRFSPGTKSSESTLGGDFF
jgi:hypothetical protein